MARPQSASDEEIVVRVAEALAGREWPQAAWTLAEVAPAAQLSPAGLVKRFGSRAGLLRALGAHWVATIPESPIGQDSPIAELRAFARDTFGAPTAAAALAGIGDLFADLADEGTSATLRAGNAKQRRYVAELLRKAAGPRAGEPDRAAGALLDALHGGMLRWATGGDGTAVTTDDTIDYFLELWT